MSLTSLSRSHFVLWLCTACMLLVIMWAGWQRWNIHALFQKKVENWLSHRLHWAIEQKDYDVFASRIQLENGIIPLKEKEGSTNQLSFQKASFQLDYQLAVVINGWQLTVSQMTVPLAKLTAYTQASTSEMLLAPLIALGLSELKLNLQLSCQRYLKSRAQGEYECNLILEDQLQSQLKLRWVLQFNQKLISPDQDLMQLMVIAIAQESGPVFGELSASQLLVRAKQVKQRLSSPMKIQSRSGLHDQVHAAFSSVPTAIQVSELDVTNFCRNGRSLPFHFQSIASKNLAETDHALMQALFWLVDPCALVTKALIGGKSAG